MTNLLKRISFILFISLLIANGIYYLSQQFSPTTKPVVTKKVDHSVPSIKLLSEVSEELIQIPKTTANSTCLLLGEFNNERTADNLKQRLLSFDINSIIVQTEADKETDFLIYLPAENTPEDTTYKIQELALHQIQGYLIASGELSGAISVGIFANRELAEVELEKLRKAGYIPRLREQKRVKTTFWLQIDEQRRYLLDDVVFKQLSNIFPELNQKFMPCE